VTLVCGGLGEDGHGSVGAGDADVVAGEGGEVVEQAAEAAVGVAGFGLLVGSFGLSEGQAQLAGHRSDRGECPCGNDRVIVIASSAATSCAPFSAASMVSMTCGGSIARLALVLDLAAITISATQQHRLIHALFRGLRHIRAPIPGYVHRATTSCHRPNHNGNTTNIAAATRPL
jgi:hypothetical protein